MSYGLKGTESEFDDALGLMETALRNGIKQFSVWMAREWTMTRAQWEREFSDPPPNGDYFDGYNAGVQSAILACEHFLDENLQ